jgi:DNA-binding NarL/FixJ family response regulator
MNEAAAGPARNAIDAVREVAALVAAGCGTREITERVFVSPRTVETHVQHQRDKLVSSRAEIAAWHAR